MDQSKEKEIQELHVLMERIAQQIKSQVKAADNPYNLANGHIFVLLSLFKESNCKTTEIVKKLGVTSGAVTGLTDKLVSLGLIERLRNEEDRRVVRLVLTDKGRETVETIRQSRMKWIGELVGRLDERNLSNMIGALRQLLVLLEEKSSNGGVNGIHE